MSSGHGKLQNEILDNLTSSPIYQNELYWKIAQSDPRRLVPCASASPALNSVINKSFLENFRRAIKRLIEEKVIQVEKKEFRTFEEIVQYYPYLTSEYAILNLRKSLLPHIATLIQEKPGSKIVSTDIENHQVDNLKEQDGKKFKQLRSDWIDLRGQIIEHLHKNNPESVTSWICLLARGELLFNASSRNFEDSFIAHFNTIKKTANQDSQLIVNIRAFIKTYFDENHWKVGSLKGRLYEHVVDFTTTLGKSALKPEAKEYLLGKARDVIIKLPEHEEPPVVPENKKGTPECLFNDKKRVFSPILDSLIKRDVFKSHTFISL